MQILAIERDDRAVNYYRIFNPLNTLDNQGEHQVEFIREINLALDPELCLQKLMWADVVVFHRPATKEWFDFIKLCQEHGKVIVCDYDDDPFNTSPWNPFYRYIGVEECLYTWPDGTQEWLWKDGVHGFNIEENIVRRDSFRACFRKADLITTTTPIMKDTLGKINPNVAVLPNYINVTAYPECELVKTQEIRIGWQGGYSHYEDLYMIREQLVRVLRENPDVKFVYLGDMGFAGMFLNHGVAPEQIELHHWGSTEVYPYKLKCLNLDIGLCPVVDNVFNRNKSAIKWLEYSMVGAASIASDIPPYKPVIENNSTGFLVKPDGWYDAMNNLIKNERLRGVVGQQAKEAVMSYHNIHEHTHEWVSAYDKALKREVNECLTPS